LVLYPFLSSIGKSNMAEQKKGEQQPNQLNIELSEEMAEGIYSNLALIAHSNSEFVIDFIRLMPGVPKAKVKSRIVFTPEHAKRLLAALKENIQKYEENFGEIRQHDELPQFPLNFGGPIGEA
jgi:predicted N-acyltransferase